MQYSNENVNDCPIIFVYDFVYVNYKLAFKMNNHRSEFSCAERVFSSYGNERETINRRDTMKKNQWNHVYLDRIQNE